MPNMEPKPGPRRPEGKMDLDAMLRRLFGASNQPPEQPGDGAALVRMLLVVLLTLLSLWLWLGSYVVDTHEKVVVYRLGSFHHVAGAGVHFGWPYPIDTHTRLVPSERKTLTLGARSADGLMLSQDSALLQVKYELQYSIAEPQRYVRNNPATEAELQDVLRAAAEQVVRREIAGQLWANLQSSGLSDINARLLQALRQEPDLRERGLSFHGLNLVAVTGHERVQADVAAVEQARKALAQLPQEATLREAAERPKDMAKLEQERQEAERYKVSVVERARVETDLYNRLLAQYQQAPAVTRDRMYFDTMQQILSRAHKVIVDTRGSQIVVQPGALPVVTPSTSSGEAAAAKVGPQARAAEAVPGTGPTPTAPATPVAGSAAATATATAKPAAEATRSRALLDQALEQLRNRQVRP